MSRQHLELTGRTFGYLTALKFSIQLREPKLPEMNCNAKRENRSFERLFLFISVFPTFSAPGDGCA